MIKGLCIEFFIYSGNCGFSVKKCWIDNVIYNDGYFIWKFNNVVGFY